MKKWSQDGKGGECNVYVTQPRRISALTLANRVAYERSEEVCYFIFIGMCNLEIIFI